MDVARLRLADIGMPPTPDSYVRGRTSAHPDERFARDTDGGHRPRPAASPRSGRGRPGPPLPPRRGRIGGAMQRATAIPLPPGRALPDSAARGPCWVPNRRSRWVPNKVARHGQTWDDGLSPRVAGLL